jgi:DUF2933 family protein
MTNIASIRCFLSSKIGLAFTLGLSVLGVYLLWTHTGHVLLAVPYVVLLACPLMHLFGHHGHGKKGNPS